MSSQELLRKAIGEQAAVVDSFMRRDIESLWGKVDDLLVEVLEYGLFNGGKRVRPLLVVLAAGLCGKKGDEVFELAKAFEYLHAATLFHDDVIDNAENRRGKPTVNVKFGLVAAILAGDYLHARSMHIVGDMAGSDGLEAFCRATAGMVDGEFMQLRNTEGGSLSESGYYEAIMGKTGLLIAAACRVGAIYGGGTARQQDLLEQYGVGLGCAFQIIDDLLDYCGDEQKTGKAVGNDLAEGKMTLPLIIGWERASAEEREILEVTLASEEQRMDGFSSVYSLLEKYGVFEETRARASAHVEKAIAQLEEFNDPGTAQVRDILVGLAHYVLEREK